MKNALASEKRRQAKIARHKSKSLERQRAYRARQKESKVSRTDDIAHIDAQAQELLAVRQALITGYQEYHAKIATQIEKILKDADVWDTVQALEAGREKRRVEDQEKVNQLGAKLDELAKVKQYLLEREAAAATSGSDEGAASTEEAPPANGEAKPTPAKGKASKKEEQATR